MSGAALIGLMAAACTETPVVVLPSLAGAEQPSPPTLHAIARAALEERLCLVARPLQDTQALGLDTVPDRCGADAGCIDQAFAASGAPAMLLLLVVRTADRWLLSARWHQAGRAATVLTEPVHAEHAGPDRALPELLRRLLDQAGLARGGHLELALDPPSARATLRDAGGGLLSPGTLLPPGRYTLRAEAEGHAAREAELQIEAGQTRALQLELVPDEPLYTRWWFWGGLGVVVLTAATAAVLLADRGPPCLCLAASDGRCDDLCRGL